jgi:RHS repeat-associated protein
LARYYSWTSFDMVETVAAGSNAATVAYTPEHERGVLTGHGASPIDFFNNPAAGVSDEMVSGSPPVWRSYLAPYGHVVAEVFLQNGTATPYYFVGDQLSSTTVLADATGASKEYDSYDAWGLRRYQNGADPPTGCSSMHPSSLTLRGYTGHEMMDAYCLVNLNARMYDPALGRVLSADPTTPDFLDGQSYDRYSYVENGPLTMTDPSGYADCFICDGHGIKYDGGSGGGYESGDGIETVVVTDPLMQELLQAQEHFDAEFAVMDLQMASLEASGGPDSPSTQKAEEKKNDPCSSDVANKANHGVGSWNVTVGTGEAASISGNANGFSSFYGLGIGGSANVSGNVGGNIWSTGYQPAYLGGGTQFSVSVGLVVGVSITTTFTATGYTTSLDWNIPSVGASAFAGTGVVSQTCSRG